MLLYISKLHNKKRCLLHYVPILFPLNTILAQQSLCRNVFCVTVHSVPVTVFLLMYAPKRNLFMQFWFVHQEHICDALAQIVVWKISASAWFFILHFLYIRKGAIRSHLLRDNTILFQNKANSTADIQNPLCYFLV